MMGVIVSSIEMQKRTNLMFIGVAYAASEKKAKLRLIP